MMNCFREIADRRKALKLIFSREHCSRFSPLHHLRYRFLLLNYPFYRLWEDIIQVRVIFRLNQTPQASYEVMVIVVINY